MRVTRLEVFGFKSFMERLVLPLEAGITGVVGPNGCGKSNTVDALRWVLGETRASNLRGGVLEDVIFNGTDKLRPLGLAEVTITMRASASDFFSDLVSPATEADIIARLAENPLSPEEIKPAEDASTEEAAPEADEGRPRLTVIQGNLENNNTQQDPADSIPTPLNEAETEALAESEEIIEVPAAEASAEATTEVKAKEAGVKEEGTSLLTRFAWLKNVNEVQVTRRLYRSGESEFFINRVSCRLKDLKDFFRAVGLGPRTYTIVAQGEVTRIISAKPEERRLILEEAAGVLGFRDKIAAANRRLDDTAQGLTRLDDVIKEVARQVGSLKVQASRAKNRQGLKDQITQIEALLFKDTVVGEGERRHHLEQALELFKAEVGNVEARVQRAQAIEQDARAELMKVDLDGDTIRSRIDTIREELNRRAEQRSSRLSRVNQLKTLVLARGTEIKRLEDRQATLQQRDAECIAEIDELKRQDLALSEMAATLGESSEEELRQIAASLSDLRGEMRKREQALRELRDRLISCQSSHSAIREQLVQASPINQLKKISSGQDHELLDQLGEKAQLFVDGLSVPDQYAKALQSVLAERSAFLVSDDHHKVARYFVNNVLTAERAKKERLGLGVFRSGLVATAPSEGASGLQEYPGLTRLLEVLKVTDQCAAAAQSILKNVYVSENAETALAFFEQHTDAQTGQLDAAVQDVRIVTLDGDIITSCSFYSMRHEGGLVQLKNKAEALEAEAKRLEEEQAELIAARDELQLSLSMTEEKQSEVLQESQARQAKAREISSNQGNVRGRLVAAQRLVQQVDQDVQRVAIQIQEAIVKNEADQEEELQLQAEIEASNPQDESALHEELRGLRTEYEKLEDIRKEGRMQLSSCADELSAARRAVDDLRTRISKLTLELQKVELEGVNAIDRFVQEYGVETKDALFNEVHRLIKSEDPNDKPLLEQCKLSSEVRAEQQREVQRLRTRIQREGEVDPSSIEAFEAESKRLQDLENQKADLEHAAATLKKTIGRLTEISEKRFVATFNAVRDNYIRLMPKLFGGGKAGLELLDPAHPLESGVEIIARPPGKKLKSIELLSGGEKALCATGLIFAMFLERPSPLCVLDEVDAPLDEANLVRFLNLVKEMCVKTQFLIITHNKNTMSVADNLVGVTMQEPGASKMISVSLQEAYSQVA